MSFFLSLSLFFWLIPWSAKACWAHFPARGSQTSWEGAWGLREQSKPRVRDFTGFLRKPRNISLFLSPLLSYRRLQTTRFQSIKGPQHFLIVFVVLCFMSFSFVRFFPCGLMIFFSSILVFISFKFLCIYYTFLICNYHRVHICWPITISVCSNYSHLSSNTLSSKDLPFLLPSQFCVFDLFYIFVFIL